MFLDELLRGELVPHRLHDLLLRELLDLARVGGLRNEVHVRGLQELLEQQLPAAVPVHERGHDAFVGQLLDRLGDAGAFRRDRVLDAVREQVRHVASSLDDDDGIRGGDVRARGQAFFPVRDELFDAHGLHDLVHEVAGAALAFLAHRLQKLLGAVRDPGAFGLAHIVDGVDLHLGLAGADAVDALEGCCEDRRLGLVEAGGQRDVAFGLALLGRDVDLDTADAAAFLQVAEVELVPEQALGLPEDGADDVGFLDDAVRGHPRFDEVLRRGRIEVHGGAPSGSRTQESGPEGLGTGAKRGRPPREEWPVR